MDKKIVRHKMKINIKCLLKEVLEKRNITQKELATLTNMREATISEIVRDSRTTYNKEHLSKIMEILEITDLNEILKVEVIND